MPGHQPLRLYVQGCIFFFLGENHGAWNILLPLIDSYLVVTGQSKPEDDRITVAPGLQDCGEQVE